MKHASTQSPCRRIDAHPRTLHGAPAIPITRMIRSWRDGTSSGNPSSDIGVSTMVRLFIPFWQVSRREMRSLPFDFPPSESPPSAPGFPIPPVVARRALFVHRELPTQIRLLAEGMQFPRPTGGATSLPGPFGPSTSGAVSLGFHFNPGIQYRPGRNRGPTGNRSTLLRRQSPGIVGGISFVHYRNHVGSHSGSFPVCSHAHRPRPGSSTD